MAQRVPRPEWPFRLAARIIIVVVRLLGWRIEVRGLENMPRRGGAVVTFNHHSYADFIMCAWPIYRQLDRPTRFLAKEELFGVPVFGAILRGAKQVPVARGSRHGRGRAFQAAVDSLQRGEIIAVAPEQTISRSFELLPFSTGTVRMAQAAGVPIVPSVNWGTQRYATKGRRLRLTRRIAVLIRYGPPLEVGPDDDPAAATDKLREAMAVMLDEVQREYPDPPVPGDDWWVPRRLGGSAPGHEEVLRAHLEREAGWRGRIRGAASSTEEQRPDRT